MRKPIARLFTTLCTALAGLAAAPAQAQPDVIVGDLYEVSNYTTGGAITGMHAFAVGTYSCNIGNVRLTWIDGNAANLYPVISQNMYRLKDGRFEQVGQAWLKHGFCALNNVLCGSCPNVPGGHSCDHLDPGCADPYSSGLNGSQGGLGPKHEINPATATWPFPNLAGSSTGNSTLKARLQVQQSDLQGQPTNTLFFVSSMYVHPEDAQFSTDNNNASYRRVTVGGNSAISLVDSTKRQSPPIFAWRDYGGGSAGGGVVDPSVILTAVDVANDGRFWVGSKVIDLGGGAYRYEYAVMNLNSDRGASSFSVPLSSGVTPQAFYFHDVPYHSGELQDGTDWSPVVSSNSLTWSYANNQTDDRRENVLRWDTIYNFSFVANAAPVTGNVSLSLFKAGSPSSVNATVAVPGTAGGPVIPINNECATALAIGAGTTSFDNTNATSSGPDACLESGQAGIARDIWYVYTSSACTEPTTITTCGSSFDTKIAVYAANCASLATPLACNDDTVGCAGGTGTGLGSSVNFTPSANTSYLVRVGAFPGATPEQGAGTITITPGACLPQPPANDACSSATWAAQGVTYTGSTENATNDGTASCGSSATSADVWFKYRPLTSGNVDIRTCGSNYDTVLSVRTACSGGVQVPSGCNDDSDAACGTNTLQSRVTVSLTAGVTYWIRVAGYQGAVGNYSLLITGGGGVVPPLNDDCAQRQGVSGTEAFSTVGASTDGVATNNCGQVFNDIWYNHPSLCTGTLTITLNGTGWTPKVAVYSGSTCDNWSARELACGFGSGNQTVVSLPVVAGQGYTVRIGGNTSTSSGAGQISFVCVPSGPTCNDIDFNNDGGLFDPTDIDAFLSVFSEGPCVPGTAMCDDIDFNNDGGLFDPCDIDSFLLVFAEGPCTVCGE